MKKQNIVVGVAPTKRGFLSMEEAKRQKEKFMAVIRGIHPDVVTLVDIDDLCENGILFETEKIPQVVEKFKKAGDRRPVYAPLRLWRGAVCRRSSGGNEGANPCMGRPG